MNQENKNKVTEIVGATVLIFVLIGKTNARYVILISKGIEFVHMFCVCLCAVRLSCDGECKFVCGRMRGAPTV